MTGKWLLSKSAAVVIQPYIADIVQPLFDVFRESDQDVLKEVRQSIAMFAQTVFAQFPAEFVRLFEQIAQSPNWHERQAFCTFLTIFTFNHHYLVREYEAQLFDIVVQLLADPQAEVSAAASDCVSSMLRRATPQQALIACNRFIVMLKATNVNSATAKAQLDEEQKQKERKRALARHGAVLGLSAVVMSAPYSVPEWMQPALVMLSRVTGDAAVQQTVKRTFSDFWRTHSESWHQLKLKFSEDELESLNALLISPNYYA